uniref:Immunoglobulin V-set domain-containing protein n=1 Tax=Oryzias latipes TaxID=8090 RepID=A0A286P9W5_ORYLA|nr:hypothetical protein [Oryzias latipes]
MLFLTVLAYSALVTFYPCSEAKEADKAKGISDKKYVKGCEVALTCPQPNPGQFKGFAWFVDVQGTKHGLFRIENGITTNYDHKASVGASHFLLGSNLLIMPFTRGYESSYGCFRWAIAGHQSEQYTFLVSNCTVTSIFSNPCS